METAVHVCELAAERRWTDLVFHRRFGHDEIDKPSFTQPKCTRLLEITPQLFRSTKTKSGQVAKEHIDRINKKVNASLNEEFLASKDYVPHRRDWFSSHWLDLSHLRVKPEILKNVGKAITSLPGNFLANRAVKKVDSLKLTTKGTNYF